MRGGGARSARTAALGALLLLAACTTSRWQFVRQRPGGKAETVVTVTSEPPGAEVHLNGRYMGTTPFEVPVRYPYELRHYERRNAIPYPHVEEKEVRTYAGNAFTFEFFLLDHARASRRLELFGEQAAEVAVRLTAK